MPTGTVAIIQARMGSTRLPGKVLEPIEGRPMIEWVVARVRGALLVDDVIVAIPDLAEDDGLHAVLRDWVAVVRGPAEDVLARFRLGAASVDATRIVRITADCPLVDPQVIDEVVGALENEHADYASNTLLRTYPRGLDVEAFTRLALDVASSRARQPYEREHVTAYIYRHPKQFRLATVTAKLDRHDWRWTVDEPADLNLVRKIFAILGDRAESAGLDEIAAVMTEHPELASINWSVRQKELGE